MVAEIKQTLYRNYQLEINTDEIRDLTFTQLSAMSDSNESNTPPVAHVANGKSEEVYETVTAILSKHPIVTMNQTEADSRTIFLIHPIQGHVEILRPIAKQLRANVYGIQCTKDADFDSISGYAGYYIEQIKTNKPHGPYFLCGYSFGAAVALEMGLQLEKNGEIAQIVLLDGSPAYVRNLLESLFTKHDKSVDKSKTAILVNFVSSFTSLNDNKVP